MDAQDITNLEVIYQLLKEAYAKSLEAGNLIVKLNNIRPDTTFACGEATGTLAKAKALVGRDIDDAWEN
jgi:hypothetical protein